MKALVHRALRALGYDIFRLDRVDAFLAQREKEARQRHIEAVLERRRDRVADRAVARGSPGVAVTWVPAEALTQHAVRMLLPAATVLDIGCGIRPQELLRADIHICCEPCQEYMDRLIVETQAESRHVYLLCDLDAAIGLFPPRSVDTVFLVDVIEHIDKGHGKAHLRRLQAIPRRQLVVFTPLGFMPQHFGEDAADHWGMTGKRWQEHRSGWTPEDFPASEGWQVVAAREFHTHDVHGTRLDPPCGAFWAVHTVS